MGTISRVIYKEVSPHTWSPIQAAEFYYHHNVFSNIDGVDKKYIENYAAYEEDDIRHRDDTIAEVMKEFSDSTHPKMRTVIWGPSAIKNKVILCMEV